jgi:hypothetical protein
MYGARGAVTRLAVRLALGADSGRVVRLVVGEDAQRIVLGVLIGVPGVSIARRTVSGWLTSLRLVAARRCAAGRD